MDDKSFRDQIVDALGQMPLIDAAAVEICAIKGERMLSHKTEVFDASRHVLRGEWITEQIVLGFDRDQGVFARSAPGWRGCGSALSENSGSRLDIEYFDWIERGAI